jgi:hypothetical protein
MGTLNGPLEMGVIFAAGLRHNLRQAHDSICDTRFGSPCRGNGTQRRFRLTGNRLIFDNPLI